MLALSLLFLFFISSSLQERENFAKSIDFLVIGVQKGGTSTLSEWISAHPQINRPKSKELLFWSNCHKNISSYVRLFPPPSGMKNVTGEFTANMLITPDCLPEILYDFNPNMKFIIVFREPAHRAHSHFVEQRDYCNCRKKFKTPCGCRPWHKLVMESKGDYGLYLSHELKKLQKRECYPQYLEYRQFLSELKTTSHFSRKTLFRENPSGQHSLYTEQLIQKAHLARRCLMRGSSALFFESFYEIFLPNFFSVFPPNQFLVLYTETDLNLTQAPTTMRMIENHLGLKPFQFPLFHIYNGKGCYGWTNACSYSSSSFKEEDKEVLEQARQMYLPHTLQLKLLADAGLIRPPPSSWFEPYLPDMTFDIPKFIEENEEKLKEMEEEKGVQEKGL